MPGWTSTGSFGTTGPDGLWTFSPLSELSPRIAIHVVCTGPDDVIVLASTDANWTPMEGGAAQAATFNCAMGGQESRVELTADTGSFQTFAAAAIRNPSSIVDTSFVVSIEVPDATKSASPSLPSGPVLPSISVSPAPSN
jgi:hypothetical protein